MYGSKSSKWEKLIYDIRSQDSGFLLVVEVDDQEGLRGKLWVCREYPRV